MTRADYITIVSGAPRSGTSLMMRMLDAGGIPALTDGRRAADEQNPHGYFEFEPVKRLAADSSWLEEARGRAVKIVYPLLRSLPPRLQYRVVFMTRDLNEVFESQKDMLIARGDKAASQQQPARLIPAMAAGIRDALDWLKEQSNFRVLEAKYSAVVRDPADWARRLNEFLDGGLDEAAIAAAVDPSLYLHRLR